VVKKSSHHREHGDTLMQSDIKALEREIEKLVYSLYERIWNR